MVFEESFFTFECQDCMILITEDAKCHKHILKYNFALMSENIQAHTELGYNASQYVFKLSFISKIRNK